MHLPKAKDKRAVMSLALCAFLTMSLALGVLLSSILLAPGIGYVRAIEDDEESFYQCVPGIPGGPGGKLS